MKKWLIAVLLGCGVLATAAGCGTDPLPNAGNQIPSTIDGLDSMKTGNQPVTSQEVVPPPVVSQTNGISLEDAKQIALRNENLSEATFIKMNHEVDHGVQKYEVGFYVGNTTYDYEIDGNNGTILKASKTVRDVNQPTTQQQPVPNNNTGNAGATVFVEDIGSARAQQIALQHAQLNASDVVGMRTKLDYDDGVQVYEVEFYQGRTEYQYEINAGNGSIVKFEKDYD